MWALSPGCTGTPIGGRGATLFLPPQSRGSKPLCLCRNGASGNPSNHLLPRRAAEQPSGPTGKGETIPSPPTVPDHSCLRPIPGDLTTAHSQNPSPAKLPSPTVLASLSEPNPKGVISKPHALHWPHPEALTGGSLPANPGPHGCFRAAQLNLPTPALLLLQVTASQSWELPVTPRDHTDENPISWPPPHMSPQSQGATALSCSPVYFPSTLPVPRVQCPPSNLLQPALPPLITPTLANSAPGLNGLLTHLSLVVYRNLRTPAVWLPCPLPPWYL